MSETDTPGLNGDAEAAPNETENLELKDNVDSDPKNEAMETTTMNNGGNDETADKTSEAQEAEESEALPIVIDDLAELGVEWMITRNEDGIEYAASEILENVEDAQLDIGKSF